MRKKGNNLPLLQRWLGGFRLKVIMCALLAVLMFCGHASADPAKYKPNSAWDLSYVLPPSPAIGDLYGFLGVGQPSVIKPGGAGLVLKSRGTNQMPGWEAENTGTVAIANGGTGATTQQDAINALAGATTSAQYLRGNGTNVSMSAIQAGDVPTLNQSTTGNAATATALAANPTDCSAGQYATAIAANGDLSCSIPLGSQYTIITLARSLNALLVFHEVDFPKTHDLVLLENLVREISPGLKGIPLHILNRYSIEARYPGDWETITRAEAVKAVDVAKKVRDAMRSAFPESIIAQSKS